MTAVAKFLFYFLIVTFVCALPLSVQAQKTKRADSTWNNWNVRLSPFFWFVGMHGTIYNPPYPAPPLLAPPDPIQLPEPVPFFDVNKSFSDLKGSLKFAMMISLEYRNEHIVVQGNLTSFILAGEAISPFEYLLQDIHLNFDFLAGDLLVGYRLVKNPKFEMDGLIGLKYLYTYIYGDVNVLGRYEFKGNRKEFWVDPVIGLRLKYKPVKKFEFSAYGDLGGPLLGPDLSYQAIGGVSYLFSRTFLISAGYRLWGIKFESGESTFNGQIRGAMIRLGFQF